MTRIICHVQLKQEALADPPQPPPLPPSPVTYSAQGQATQLSEETDPSLVARPLITDIVSPSGQWLFVHLRRMRDGRERLKITDQDVKAKSGAFVNVDSVGKSLDAEPILILPLIVRQSVPN